ncbi:MAG: LacI family DNA-binding transcriptional regulator, partial [Maricaulaceae bacterium]
TLHDVAARAGVSVATASRYLAGIKVSNKNADAVRKAADALGYVPNIAARALKSDRTLTVGVVFDQLSGPLGTELLDALASGLDEHGYCVFLATAQSTEERFDALAQRFLERRVDALMCVNAIGEGKALARYESLGIPVIALFGKSGGYEKLPTIAPVIAGAVREACERLIALGHETIGVVRPARRSRPIEGFRTGAKRAGLTVRSFDLPEGPFDPVGLLNTLMNETQRPTAIIAPQSEATQIFEAADALSIIVPRMLSIIAIRDRTLQMPTTRLPLSMIHLNPAKVGVVAAELVVEALLEGTAIKGDRSVEMGSWIERGTTAAPS